MYQLAAYAKKKGIINQVLACINIYIEKVNMKNISDSVENNIQDDFEYLIEILEEQKER